MAMLISLRLEEWKVVEAGPVTASVEAECSNIAVGILRTKILRQLLKSLVMPESHGLILHTELLIHQMMS